MENPDVTPIIKELIKLTSLPLTTVENDFTIDSSGFGTQGLLNGLITNTARK